jgi:ribosomal protein L29
MLRLRKLSEEPRRKDKMAILKSKDIARMPDNDKKEKLKELRLELIKANVTANKTGKIKIKEIRRTIAKLLTLMAKKPEKH